MNDYHIEVLEELEGYCRSWSYEARVLGNVKAGDVASALMHLVARVRELEAESAEFGKFMAEQDRENSRKIIKVSQVHATQIQAFALRIDELERTIAHMKEFMPPGTYELLGEMNER